MKKVNNQKIISLLMKLILVIVRVVTLLVYFKLVFSGWSWQKKNGMAVHKWTAIPERSGLRMIINWKNSTQFSVKPFLLNLGIIFFNNKLRYNTGLNVYTEILFPCPIKFTICQILKSHTYSCTAVPPGAIVGTVNTTMEGNVVPQQDNVK